MKRQREIILLLTSIFIVTCAWIGFNLYHDTVNTTISQPLQEDIIPITPNFNTTVIRELKKRVYVNPEYNFSQQKVTTQTPVASAPATLTPTIEISLSPTP